MRTARSSSGRRAERPLVPRAPAFSLDADSGYLGAELAKEAAVVGAYELLDQATLVVESEDEPSTEQAEKIEAARVTGVRKIVLLSPMGTVLQPLPVIGVRIAARDDVFRRSGLDITHLRAGGLMSNALWWIPSINEAGQGLDGSDPGKLSVIDPYDVARVAAHVLTTDGHAGHGYLLTGPEALSARDQDEILADVLGRPIEFVAPSPAEFARMSIDRLGTPELPTVPACSPTTSRI